MTKVVNFFAGPGAGKSTIAAAIFVRMKRLGLECELVTEFAKLKVWEYNNTALHDQFYISAKQNYHLRTLIGQVDYVITDSPILLGIIYDSDNSTHLRNYLLERHNSYDNINFLIERPDIKFTSNGRVQSSLDEAITFDVKIHKLLHEFNVPFTIVKLTDEDAILRNILGAKA